MDKKVKLSVVLAVRNEEANIGRCLSAVTDIADEIIIMDEYSTDKTVEIAQGFGAKVFSEPHHENFHITKQKAIDKAQGEWILQLDADEQVSPELAKEIREVITMSYQEIKNRKIKDHRKWKLFMRHQKVIEEKYGQLGKKTGEIVAFFVPRRNMFLGKALVHAGVYPDAVIRLIGNGKAGLPAESVHEQIMWMNGEVDWLTHDLLHYDSPTLKRYFDRANRYTSFTASTWKEQKMKKNFGNFVYFIFIKPIITFLSLFIRHAGFKDGIRGFLWSIFSAWHFPLAYYKYWIGSYN
ncbi:MAG: glycosyltransferase family 2 protein [Patescibacteria group bacterium]